MTAKWRGVLMVPTVIEFESEGSVKHVEEQALNIARGMGKADSLKYEEKPYEPKLMELCITEGELPEPELDIDFFPEPARA
jgi:hypothetical protein